LGSVGTHLHAGPNRIVVGIDVNATHHKSATSGKVTAVATAVTLGKTLCCYEVEIPTIRVRELAAHELLA